MEEPSCVGGAFRLARLRRVQVDAASDLDVQSTLVEYAAVLGQVKNAAQLLNVHSSGKPEIEWARAVIERQARLRRSDLIKDLLRCRRIRSQVIGADVCHPLFDGIPNDFGVGLENIDRQQTVMVGWLLVGRNPEPAMIGVKS